MNERSWKIYLLLSQNMFSLFCVITLVRYEKYIGIDYNYKKICHKQCIFLEHHDIENLIEPFQYRSTVAFCTARVRANAIEKIFRKMESHSL